MNKVENQKLLAALIQRKLISQSQAEDFMKKGQPSINAEGVSQSIIKFFHITEHQLDETIAEEFNIPFLYTTEGLQWINVSSLPDEASAKYRFIPIIIEDLELTVAFVDPPYKRLIELLENATHRQIVPVVITPSAFDMLLMNRSKEVQKQVSSTFDFEVIDVVKRGEKWATNKDTVQKLPSVNSVFTKLIEAAIDNKASHLHFNETSKGFLNVRFRIHGVMNRVVTLPIRYTSALPSLIKQAARIDDYQSNRPIKRKSIIKIRDTKINLEIATIPSEQSEKLTIRLINTKTEFLNLEEIGLSEPDKIRFNYLVHKPGSMILFAGPPQSGKSTTMYSALQFFNKERINIASASYEEVEIPMEGVTQVTYSKAEGMTLQDSVNALGDHNLDILAIDEISENTRMDVLFNISFRNTQIFSTIEARNVFDALYHLSNWVKDKSLLMLTLHGIISQKIVRKVCPVCAEKYRPKPELLEFIGLKNFPNDVLLTHGTGCQQCMGTGYLGIIPVFETLLFTDKMKSMFIKGCSLPELQEEAEKQKFTTMRYDGLRKAIRGLTTLDEVLRQT